jgi:peptidoglycan/xylan/chitin deacetylase (PgdA/CDA1 family)
LVRQRAEAASDGRQHELHESVAGPADRSERVSRRRSGGAGWSDWMYDLLDSLRGPGSAKGRSPGSGARPSPGAGTVAERPMSRLRRHAIACLSSPWMQPLSHALSRWYGGISTSLLYHRITAGKADRSIRRCAGFRPNLCLAVAEDRFDEQMAELAANHHCLSLPDAVQALRHERLERGSVTVTFDDGYRDNLRVALPIIERYGVPATVCITTGLIDRSALLWWDELEHLIDRAGRIRFAWQGVNLCFGLDDAAARRAAFARIARMFRAAPRTDQQDLMVRLRAAADVHSFSYEQDILDWDEVRQLDRHPLITIAAHTVNHPALRNVDAATASQEMRQSRARLEQMLGHRVPYFAYPFGGADEAGRREFELCAAEGFEFALTTRPGHWQRGHRDHTHALPRMMIEYFDTLDDFRFKLSGLEAFLRQKGRRFVTV